MDLNRVFLIGRLTADPQLRATSSGSPVASFSIATNRNWKDKSGEQREQTEFHNIVVWGRQAETVNQFVGKGDTVMVEGRLQTRTWEGRDGQKRRTTEIVAIRVQFGPRSRSGASEVQQKSQRTEEEKKENLPEFDIEEGGEIDSSDIPF